MIMVIIIVTIILKGGRRDEKYNDEGGVGDEEGIGDEGGHRKSSTGSIVKKSIKNTKNT